MLRAFKTTIYFTVDENERDEEDSDGNPLPQPTNAEIFDYIEEALMLDINTEEYGNPVGFQSAEIDYSETVELSRSEVKKRYGR